MLFTEMPPLGWIYIYGIAAVYSSNTPTDWRTLQRASLHGEATWRCLVWLFCYRFSMDADHDGNGSIWTTLSERLSEQWTRFSSIRSMFLTQRQTRPDDCTHDGGRGVNRLGAREAVRQAAGQVEGHVTSSECMYGWSEFLQLNEPFIHHQSGSEAGSQGRRDEKPFGASPHMTCGSSWTRRHLYNILWNKICLFVNCIWRAWSSISRHTMGNKVRACNFARLLLLLCSSLSQIYIAEDIYITILFIVLIF